MSEQELKSTANERRLRVRRHQHKVVDLEEIVLDRERTRAYAKGYQEGKSEAGRIHRTEIASMKAKSSTVGVTTKAIELASALKFTDILVGCRFAIENDEYSRAFNFYANVVTNGISYEAVYAITHEVLMDGEKPLDGLISVGTVLARSLSMYTDVPSFVLAYSRFVLQHSPRVRRHRGRGGATVTHRTALGSEPSSEEVQHVVKRIYADLGFITAGDSE